PHARRAAARPAGPARPSSSPAAPPRACAAARGTRCARSASVRPRLRGSRSSREFLVRVRSPAVVPGPVPKHIPLTCRLVSRAASQYSARPSTKKCRQYCGQPKGSCAAPQPAGDVWRDGGDREHERPEVAALEGVCGKDDGPWLALPEPEAELEDERQGEPAEADGHERPGPADAEPRQGEVCDEEDERRQQQAACNE